MPHLFLRSAPLPSSFLARMRVAQPHKPHAPRLFRDRAVGCTEQNPLPPGGPQAEDRSGGWVTHKTLVSIAVPALCECALPQKGCPLGPNLKKFLKPCGNLGEQRRDPEQLPVLCPQLTSVL